MVHVQKKSFVYFFKLKRINCSPFKKQNKTDFRFYRPLFVLALCHLHVSPGHCWRDAVDLVVFVALFTPALSRVLREPRLPS